MAADRLSFVTEGSGENWSMFFIKKTFGSIVFFIRTFTAVHVCSCALCFLIKQTYGSIVFLLDFLQLFTYVHVLSVL
jgi:hypothetical protein